MNCLVIFVLNIVTMNVCAQKIVVDKMKDGIRNIITSEKPVYDRLFSQVSVSLGNTVSDDDYLLFVNFEGYSKFNKISMSENSRLLLKCANDEVMTFRSFKDASKINKSIPFCYNQYVTTHTGGYVGGKYYSGSSTMAVPQISNVDDSSTLICYIVSKDQIEKMISDGVIKMRIETVGKELVDLKIKSKKFVKVLAREYNLIVKQKKLPIRDTFTDGF